MQLTKIELVMKFFPSNESSVQSAEYEKEGSRSDGKWEEKARKLTDSKGKGKLG